jgi:hypothetical protein
MQAKGFGVVCLVGAALGVSATGAGAAPAPVFLLQAGKIASPGETVQIAEGTPMIEHEQTTCFGSAEGTLTSNAKPTDTLTLPTGGYTCLPSGNTLWQGGHAKRATISSLGRLELTYSPKLVLQVAEYEPASTCIWDVSKLEGEMDLPGAIGAPMSGVAKRAKGSDATCPKTAPVELMLEYVQSGGQDVIAETYS